MGARRLMAGRRRGACLVTLLVLGGLLCACGIPVDATAKPVSPAQAGLFAGAPQIPGTSYKPGSTPFLVYFVRDGELFPVRRYLSSSTLSVTAEATAALESLNAGPTLSELGESITTSLRQLPPANLKLDSVDSGQHLAHVILDAEFRPSGLFGTTLALAFAQIVYTLTSSVFDKQITSVAFTLDGQLWPAYLPTGDLDLNPAQQQDYSAFVGAQTRARQSSLG